MTHHMEHDPLNPSYYKGGIPGVDLEVIEYTRHMCFTLGNAFKYVARAGSKGSLKEDLGKAAWYLRAYAEDVLESVGADDRVISEELLGTITFSRSARSCILWFIACGNHVEALTYIESALHELGKCRALDLDEE